METQTINYVVAATLIICVIIKIVARYMKEQNNTNKLKEI